MTRIDLVNSDGLYERAEEIISRLLGRAEKILKTPLGKPYIGGNPIFISLSHTQNRAAIATDYKPVGVDLETPRSSGHDSILKRFSERERAEILSERDFLVHWTAREAFVKMRGETLASTFKRLEFFGGKIYLDGDGQPCSVRHFFLNDTRVLCVCTEDIK